MSIQSNYTKKLEEIRQIKTNEIKLPRVVPVDAFLQRAENLYLWCQSDKEELENLGLDWNIVEDLQASAGALREAESRWVIFRYSKNETEQQWRIGMNEGYDLRNELLSWYRFAYRNQEHILGRVKAIGQGRTHTDMIQDLNDLSVLGLQYQQELNAVGFDMQMLSHAAHMSETLAGLLAQAITQRAKGNEIKTMRDKSFTYLKRKVDTIREYGLFATRNKPERSYGYKSAYTTRRRKSKTSAPVIITMQKELDNAA